MQVSTANDVKVYNLSAGKSLPEWISDRKRRTLLKEDVDLRRRIELIQDFTMPTASTGVQVTRDGQYILTTGVYKPRVRCYDVNQLSMKFERCLDAEVVEFNVLSEDYSKFVLLLSNRFLEFHVQYGYHYRTRIPCFGRDTAYHYPSCDLYVASCSSDVYRLNLEQGRFMKTLVTQASGCNKCEFNSEHQLFTVGTENGTVECWDPRSLSCVGRLSLASAGVEFSDQEGITPGVTSLKYKDALNLAVGTSTGQILLYDIRSCRPYQVKDHYYGLPIHSLAFQKKDGLVLSADSRILKIWKANDCSAFTSMEPEHDINQLCYHDNSGLLFMATEDPKLLSYYIPLLGPAPRWCSFLDTLTEELEEDPEPTVYEDYKFVTHKDLENLGLSHLLGTNLLRAYMHGFFMDMRLYHKAKAIAQPFAYDEYRKAKIKTKIEEQRTKRIERTKLPKVNRPLAERLLSSKDKSGENLANPLGDARFSAMFANPDFQVDEESEEYQFLHPVFAKKNKKMKKQSSNTAAQPADTVQKEEEPEGRPSDEETSSDDDEVWSELRRKRREAGRRRREVEREAGSRSGLEEQVKLRPLSQAVQQPKLARLPLSQRVTADKKEAGFRVHQGSVLGSRELRVQLKKSDEEARQKMQLQDHRLERKKLRRSASSILPRAKRGPVYWKGKRVK